MLEPSHLATRQAFAMLEAIGPTPNGVTARERVGCELAVMQSRRGREAQLAERLRAEFGLALPDGPRRAFKDDIALLGIGPSRWLAISSGGTKAFPDALERTVAGCASVIEQTDGIALLRISGPRARDTFAKGLPIDLEASVFGIDAVAVSVLLHVSVTIWRLDDEPTFEIAVPRSYAGAFFHWLRESAAEFGLAIK